LLSIPEYKLLFCPQGGKGDLGAWKASDIPDLVLKEWNKLKKEYEYICSRQPMAKAQNHANHLGTLGTGNHFIEVFVLFELKCNVLVYILLV